MEIKPFFKSGRTVTVPGSKSYSQRAMVISALAAGDSTLWNPLVAEDTLFLLNALRDMGASFTAGEGQLFVRGTSGVLANPGRQISLGNNGTAMRLLISLAALGRGEYTLTGEKRLCERPVEPLLSALRQLGTQAKSAGGNGCPPVVVQGGNLNGGRAVLKDIDSSQYISSLLIAGPFAREDTEIEVRGPIPSEPYIDLTLQAMRDFGAEAGKTASGYFVRAGRVYGARQYRVEADVSSASYFFLAAALCGGTVRVDNVMRDTIQGDILILRILEQAGCSVLRGDCHVEVAGGKLAGGEMVLDMGDIPDMVPTVAALAAVRPGRTVVRNAAHLRVKESNRLKALVTELRKTGVKARETADGMIIEGGDPRGASIETYNDHRIAMSFAVLGLAVPGMKINNPECVGKSFPGFWKELGKLQG